MTTVDLFCGAGGFSLGAKKAGLDVALSVDVDPILTSSYLRNFPGANLLLRDIARLDGATIEAMAGVPVDGVFGGPPCQGFSDIGRRDAGDPRRQLLGHFFRIISELRPMFFVMENVRGLAYADARGVLDAAISSLGGRYDVLGPAILDAAHYGAATARRRLFVVGVHKDHGDPVTLADIEVARRRPATVREAIADVAKSVRMDDDDGFDLWRIVAPGRPSSYARLMRAGDRTFTGHRVIDHRPEVARRFASIPPGGIDRIGRHPRLSWDGQCPTLRAGTSVERGSFQAVRPIHPEQARVITVREAARLQGFPDDHRLHPTAWHSFRMIGNSVSPVIAEAIFGAVVARLTSRQPSLLAAE